jgi:cytochrome c biogenesis protein CcdA/glutaredoxin
MLLVMPVFDPAPASAGSSAEPPVVEIVVFHGDGCPHCAKLLAFLDELDDRYPDLIVTLHEVWHDTANQALMTETLAAFGEEPQAVPTVVIGEIVIVGYSPAIADRIETIVAELFSGRPAPDPEQGAYVIDVPLVGAVDVGSRSMVGATLLIAFVDGVNPCSLWVLSMLLALVVHSGSRRRVLAVGALFLLVTSLLYGLYMVGAYSTLAVVGERAWIRAGVAVIAGSFGILHLKEHFTSRGPSVTIPDERKPGIYRRMRRLADMERSLPATLGGTALLAVGVSLLETPCTAGLPLLWTNLIADRDIALAGASVLFVLYLLVFLLDELVLFGGAVLTMRAAKLQEHHGRLLQLIGGTLMLTLAVAMLAAPGLLEQVTGTAIVFGIAAGVAVVVLLVERRWAARHRGRAARRRAARAV